jgi:PDZ domain-containing protein
MGSFPEPDRPPQIPGKPDSFGTALAKLIVPFLFPLMFFFTAVPTGFLLESPGPSFDLQAGLTVTGAETYATPGEFLLTSVSLQESRLIFHVMALLKGDYEMIKMQDYLGKDLDTEGQNAIDELVTILSQDTAVVVALEETGKAVSVEEIGALVLSVGEGYPADGVLEEGDVVVAVDGEPVESVGMLTERITSLPEGEAVTLTIRKVRLDLLNSIGKDGSGPNIDDVPGTDSGLPDPAELLSDGEWEVSLTPRYEPELERSLIGVALDDYFTYSSEVGVEWQLESVRGPSAGLMMTLSLVNTLTPEDLTGGEKIAGTGEILLDGSVGPIGGLPMKIRGAESEGAEIFIYPAANQEDLDGISTDLELYAVENLDDALEVLEGIR